MPKSLFWPTAIFALAMIASPAAFALSVDRDSDVNANGTAKFADPDEQKPAFMTGSPENRSGVGFQSNITQPMSPGMVGVEGNQPSNPYHNQGPDAFDQAFQHK